jgi:effector-binding domain-containing protein
MMMTYQIGTKTLTQQLTAVVRAETSRGELPAWMAGTVAAVREYLSRVGGARTGPPFARYAFLGDTVAVEAGFPVDAEIAGDGLVEPSMLPDGPVVTVTHVGDYANLGRAYLAAHAWIRDHGAIPASPHWEIYHTNPAADADVSHWRTELVVPYRPVRWATAPAQRRG